MEKKVASIGEILISHYAYRRGDAKGKAKEAVEKYLNEEGSTVEALMKEIALELKKQKLSFEHFCKIFAVVKFAISKNCSAKKDKAPNSRFGEATIVLGSAYLSPFYSSKEESTKMGKINNLLNFTETANIKARLDKAIAAGQTAISNICIFALIKRKEASSAASAVFPKLLDEYFIDSRKREPKRLVLTPLIARLIDQKALTEIFLPKTVLLLNRTEDNIDSLVALLSLLPNDKDFDTSNFAAEILLNNLKPYYYSLNGQQIPSQAAFQLVKKIKSLPVLQKILDSLAGILSLTNDEKKRMPVLKILHGASLALPLIEGDKKLAELKIVQILGDNANAVQTIDDLQNYFEIVDTFFKNSSETFLFSSDYAVLLKRKIAIAIQNKLVYAAICRICSQYIRRYASLRENLNEVKELVDGIIASIFLPNVKAPTKLITNSEPFLAALEVVTFAANYEPLSAVASVELKKVIKTVILSDKIVLNKHEFLSKITLTESALFFSSLLQISQISNLDISNDLSALTTFGNSFIQLFFGSAKRGSTDILNEVVKKGLKQWKNITEILTQGIFNFLYYQLEVDTERSLNRELLSSAIVFLGSCVKHLTAEELKSIVNIELLPWIIYHPLAHQRVTKRFRSALSANEGELKAVFRELIPSKHFSNPFLLISDQMLQNPSLCIRSAAQGYATFLIELGYYEFLEPFKTTLEISNYDLANSKLIEGFEVSVVKTSDEYEQLRLADRTLLVNLGYKVDPNIEPTGAVQQEAPKKGGAGKKPANNANNNQPSLKKFFEPYLPAYRFQTGHSFLDDEELKVKSKEELRERMAHFYRLACKFYTIFSESNNPDISEYFFRNLNDSFFCSSLQKHTHQNYREILANVLRKYRSQIKSQALFLADFTITIARKENPTEKVIREFINFQSFINNNLNTEDPHESFIIPYIHKLNFHTIKEDGFDMDTKVNALVFYNKLPAQYNDYLLALYLPFNNNINTLASSNFCQIVLEKLLLIIKQEDTSVLFHNILNNVPNAKKCVLASLISQSSKINYHPSFEEIIKLRIMQIDLNADVKAFATKILSSIKYELTSNEINRFDFISFITDHSIENVDKFAELCLEIIKTHPELHKGIFTKLTEAAEACYDQHITEEALTFYPKYIQLHLSNIQPEQLTSIFNLFVQKYCNPSLHMLMDNCMQCGIELIKKFGSGHSGAIVQIFDKYLKSNNPEDGNKQISAIVFLGVCAPFIKNKQLLETVSTKIILLFKNGTEDLQKSLAKCLPDLMSFFDNAKGLIEKNIQNLPFEPTTQQRKGQAYLIAGLIKGLGIGYIEKLNIFKYIDEDLESKKDIQQKESILLLITCFIDILGRVFEPFIVRVIKVLMFFFGETNESVKDLALNATKLLMSKLTGYGVKIILPQLLQGLEDSSWRAKFNNIWALGNMAFCSPKQMSQCLPQIVPQLSNCLSDTHPKIREVANSSLTLIGSSIKNPEISDIVDILIQALSDPFDLNKTGLEILLKTRFVHYIDAPALSLVIPIVDYALTQKRESRPKEDACQVVGSISQLIKEPKDIIPYMEILVNSLRNALSDNDNEVRLFAAKATGQLCKTLGQANSEKYFRFIRDILESKTSTSIERSGAAQALSEIICILGIDYFKSQLPLIFEQMGSKNPWVKEGYIGVFVFVPVILKENFNQFIKEVLEVTSEFVADEEEKVREIALRVLRILIQNFGETQTHLLTGPVNEGLFSHNWRKRLSSVVLSSEMLEILQKMVRAELNYNEENNIKRDENTLSEKQTLLYENFMAVYILRADEMEQIRLQSSQVWKNFVENTPRTLKYGLRILFDRLISAISRGKPVETIAKTAVFNFCQKYGESFFAQVLKVFKDIISENAGNISLLRGAILVLSEYCKNLNGGFLRNFQEELVEIIKCHVYTHDSMFRSSVFYSLRVISERIGEIGLLKNTLNEVFDKIRDCSEQDPQFETYLKIFDQLCQSKSEKIMQYIVPQLFHRPIPSPLIEVITNNSEVLSKIVYKLFKGKSAIEIMFEEIFSEQNQSRKESLIYAVNQLSINLTEEDSRFFILDIIEKINQSMKVYQNSKEQENHLEIILAVLGFYMTNTSIHLSEFNKDLINLVNPFIFEYNCPKIVSHATTVLHSIFSILNRRYFVELQHTFALSVEDCLSKEKFEKITEIAGFNCGEQPGDGVRAFIELITTCLVYTPEESFQDSIDLFKHVVKYTTFENLASFNFKLTGPLIRVANYQLEIHEKQKVLQLFLQLFSKGLNLKPFVPQLISTFAKICQEFAREKDFQKLIAENLNEVTLIAPRKDLILHELYLRSKEAEDKQLQRETFLYLTYRLLKFNNEVPEDKKLFAKAFLEKIFTECLQSQEEARELSISNITLYAKVIGILSSQIQHHSLEKYLKDSLTIFKGSNESKYVFEYLSNVLSIYTKNPTFSTLPEDIAAIITSIVEKFDKEYQYPSVNAIKKLIKSRNGDPISAYFAANIPKEILEMNIEEDEDIVHQEEEDEEEGKDEEEDN